MSFLHHSLAQRRRTQAQLLLDTNEDPNPMFPSSYYGLFPAFPTTNRVFVAMPFGERFGLRWEHVIRPAIESTGLEPFRVDLSKVADSIPLRILQEIGTCRLVFADVTSVDNIRNANVMYELGIAHAVRLPDEVIVFRSDDAPLPFDIAPIFADSYKPDSGPGATGAAIEQIRSAVQRALSNSDLTRHIIVQRIVDTLDVVMVEVLGSRLPPPYAPIPARLALGKSIDNVRQLSGFSRLISAGVLRTAIHDFVASYERDQTQAIATDLEFEFTPLGLAVADEFRARAYKGRSPKEAAIEYIRITGMALLRENKITADHLSQLLAEAAAGDGTVLARMLTLRHS